MRRMLAVLLVAGCFYSLFATDARVITMGRSDNFFMDDISIFKNPANINVYPNMLLGGFGTYVFDSLLDPTGQLAGLQPHNRDPQKPIFGGILSYSLNQSTDAGNQYPMLSFGVVLNRYDKMLSYLIPNDKNFFGDSVDSKYKVKWARPVGKVDFMLGYALRNGGMLGGGAYVAFQNVTEKEDDKEQVKVIRGNLGVNLPVAKTIDFEVSASTGLMSAVGRAIDATNGSESKRVVADNDYFVSGDFRLFSALANINGDFVPHAGLMLIKYHGDLDRLFSLNGGIGVNINIDRGFFWTGIEGIYETSNAKYIGLNDTNYSLEYRNKFSEYDKIGGRISFGIERNIVWDWLLFRLGGSKYIGFERVGGPNGNMRWIENPEADASDDDQVGFGVAVNIENRFKVDAVMAEDLFYTFSNLISGNHHHIFTRISATYSF